MIIGGFDTDRRVLVVAEIGNNHEGDFAVAQELVRQAAVSGAGAVKFQTFRTEHFVSPSDAQRFARLRSFQLSYPRFAELAALARSLGLLFVSTPLDLESARFLATIVDAMKIASGDNTFFPLLEVAARSAKPLVVSCGLAELEEIAASVDFVRDRWGEARVAGRLALLHCVSSYPAPPEQINLRAIEALARRFPDCTIGYSDHAVGIDAAVAAVALGARIVEKHFTLDKSYSDFRDHQLSADPADLRELVRRVAATERLLGMPEKRVQPAEEPGRIAFRRSIAAASDLPAGHRLRLADLTWLRPAGGLAPGEERRLLDRVLKRPVRAGEPLRPSDVE